MRSATRVDINPILDERVLNQPISVDLLITGQICVANYSAVEIACTRVSPSGEEK